MRNNTLSIIKIAIFAMLFLQVGCSKNGDNTKTSGNTTLLTQKSWKISKYEIKIGKESLYEDWSKEAIKENPCFFNYILSFKTDGQLQVQGTCDGNATTETGTWKLSNDGNTLTLSAKDEDGEIQSGDLNVVSLTENTMILITHEVYGNTDYYFRYTYTH